MSSSGEANPCLTLNQNRLPSATPVMGDTQFFILVSMPVGYPKPIGSPVGTNVRPGGEARVDGWICGMPVLWMDMRRWWQSAGGPNVDNSRLGKGSGLAAMAGRGRAVAAG